MLTSQAASDQVTASERRGFAVEALQSTLADFAHDYKDWLLEVDASPTRLGQPPLWPSIWHAVERSLKQLTATFDTERAEKPVKKVR